MTDTLLPIYVRIKEILDQADIDLPVDERLQERMLMNYAHVYIAAQRDLLAEQRKDMNAKN